MNKYITTLLFFILWERIAWVSKTFSIWLQFIQSDHNQFSERMTSLIHALVTIVGCYCVLTDVNIHLDHLYGYSVGAMKLFQSSCGYFMWDLYVSAFSKNVEWAFVLHAASCVLCYSFVQYPYLHYYGVRFLLFEISTPFLNIMQLLRQLRYKGTFYFIIQCAFFLTFVLTRIIYGSYISYYFWLESLDLLYSGEQHSTFVVLYYCFANIALNSINVFWMTTMIKKQNRN